MTRKWIFCLLAFSAIISVDLCAATSIQNVALSSSSVARLDKFEISFDLAGTSFTNPYDPTQIDVSAIFTDPVGNTRLVHGFYMQEFTRSCGPTENLTPGAWKWKARYSPDMAGAWSVDLTAVDSISGTGLAGPFAFSCGASATKGLVRVSSADYRYFEYEDGSQYIPIGQNLAWSSTANWYSCDFDIWIPQIASNGGNMMRWWFTTFNTAVEWNDWGGTLGDYTGLSDQHYRADYIFELARSNDLQMMVTLLNMGDLRATGFENKWPYNVYNSVNGGPCANPQDFFTNAAARDYFKRRLRYTVARWGYASNIIWETWNELNFVDNYNSGNIAAWHVEMIDYLKAIDLNRHIVGVSFSDPVDEDPNINSLSQIDFTSFHRYSPSNAMEDEHLATTLADLAAFGKPVLGGETGIAGGSTTVADPYGVHFHNSAWGSLLSGASGTHLFWDWDNYLPSVNVYNHYQGLANFTATLDFSGSGFVFQMPGATTPGYKDYTVGPLWDQWGNPAPASTFAVSGTGFLNPDAGSLGQYLHSSGCGGCSRRNPPTFNVDYSSAGQFSFEVEPGPSGSNTIRIEIDTVQVFSQVVSGGAVYTVPVTAGPHSIFIENAGGGDWIKVKEYKFVGYTPSLKAYVLAGASTVAGWVLNRDYNHDFVRDFGTPAAVSGGMLHLTGMVNGIWNVEWWDTVNGGITSIDTVSAVGGNLDLSVPDTAQDRAFKMTLSGVAPTATPTLTVTPAWTATETWTPTGTWTPTASPTATNIVCVSWNFDDGTVQGWNRDIAFDTGVTAMAVSGVNTEQGPYSLDLSVDLVMGGVDGGVIYVDGGGNGFPRDYSDGRVLTAWIWIPAGMSPLATPNGAFLYAKTGPGWVWYDDGGIAWTNLPNAGGWVQLSLDMSGAADNDDVGQIGIKIALGAGSPDWSGQVYVDSIDDDPAPCGMATATISPSPTATATSTVTATATVTPSPTPGAVGSNTPSPTGTASPTSSPSATASGTATPTITPVPPGSTLTMTLTYSPSPTVSPSVSATGTATATATETGTPTVMLSVTDSPTSTPSATETPSPSSTVTGVATPPGIATATLTPQDYGSVAQALAVPNPQSSINGLSLSLELTGRADSCRVKIFTTGMTSVAVAELARPLASGWQWVHFGSVPPLANGIYYFQVWVVNQGQPAGRPIMGKIVILK